MSLVPRVSVVLPTYNSGVYLQEAVESILNQTLTDIELVIVEDGSTDGTAEAVAAYGQHDGRVVVIDEGHHGISGALNAGIQRSRAPLVAIMNHDDVAWPERLALQAAFLDANPPIVAVGSAMRIVDQNGEPVGFSRYDTDHESMAHHLANGFQPVGHPTFTFRRDAVLSLGGYRGYFAYAEDYDLLLRLSERHRLANLPDILLDYRAFDGNSTVRFRAQQELAARFALFAARERRDGRADPTIGLDLAKLDHLSRFNVTLDDKAALYAALAEASVWAAHQSAERLVEAQTYLIGAVERGSTALSGNRDALAEAWRTSGKPDQARRFLSRFARAERLRPLRMVIPRLIERRSSARASAAASEWLRQAVAGGDVGSDNVRPSPRHVEQVLVPQASHHQVLGYVLHNFPPFAEGEEAFSRGRAAAAGEARQLTALSAILKATSAELERRLSGLPAAVVKGPKLAALYPTQTLRSYTDIDLLADPSALDAIGVQLRAMGFELAEARPDHCEWKWLLRKNQAIMIEVQTDLVHSPALRKAFSVRYADLGEAIGRPASHLLVACIHGSLHQFERLRFLADIRQAAFAVVDAGEDELFVALVARTTSGTAVRAGLQMAMKFFDDERIRRLARMLPLHPLGTLAAQLITPRLVLSTPLRDKPGRAWQRKLFWRLLAAARTPRHAARTMDKELSP